MTNKHPKLRSHIRKRRDGSVKVYWFYDRRADALPDIPLGADYDAALKRWEEIHLHKPRIKGTLQEAFERWEAERLPAYANAGTRRNYAAGLKRLKPIFGESTWDGITFQHLTGYLDKRSSLVQGNREMALLSIIWRWAQGRGALTDCRWPAAGMEKSKWKNPENDRVFEVTDALFEAIYAEGDALLQDCMDLATATGLRLTDCRTILLGTGETLRIKASKTGKVAEFEIATSPVLTRLVAARRAIKADHLMLLTTRGAKPRSISPTMLRDRYDAARLKAAAKPENAAIADQIRAMYLRDCRKRAGDLAGSLEEASALLQHSSLKVTADHYRTRATKLKPVR